MKRLLAYLFIILGLGLIFASKSFAIKFGEGELKLNYNTAKAFIKFVKARSDKNPYIFSVAEDGKAFSYWFCPKGGNIGKANICREGNPEFINQNCLKNSKKYGSGVKCHVLAHARTVRWKNGINKKTKFNSKWTEDEILAKLAEIGFYSNTSSTLSKTIEKKKKILVTKNEFKIQEKSVDNDAPIIDLSEVITVNDTDYEFQGKVTDQSETIYIEIDGRPIEVENGKFIVKGYSPIDKELSIEAIDQWGNRSEPKIVKLIIDLKNTKAVNRLEPLNPSSISNKQSNNKIALIIGIENYMEAPKANYANLDAKYFFDYSRRVFGVKDQNIKLLVNEDATVVKTDKALSLWLKSKIKKDISDLIIFFAGHGLASSDGKELYLLPQDGNPDRLERTAISRTDLFKEIINLNPKSVTMFLDACYSGVSRDEETLLASARPIRIVADEQEGIPNNFTIFSASQLDQISSGLKEAKHGIFSYYLMKGLEGNADINQDKKITNGELLAYMDENVSQKASELGRQQNPSLAGDPDKILMSYR